MSPAPALHQQGPETLETGRTVDLAVINTSESDLSLANLGPSHGVESVHINAKDRLIDGALRYQSFDKSGCGVETCNFPAV